MEEGIEFNRSAFKHGITEANIRYAFAHKVFDHPVAGEDDKHLLVGFDTNGNPLEILYNVVSPRHINVFHAMKCRKLWLRMADER
jgi:hypothetical protein